MNIENRIIELAINVAEHDVVRELDIPITKEDINTAFMLMDIGVKHDIKFTGDKELKNILKSTKDKNILLNTARKLYNS